MQVANSDPEYNDPFDKVNREIDLFDRMRKLEAQQRNQAYLISELLGMMGLTPELLEAISDLEMEEDDED